MKYSSFSRISWSVLMVIFLTLPLSQVRAEGYLSPIAQIIESAAATQVSSGTQPAITAPLVLAYTNIERYKEGLPLLSSNTLLSEVARKKMLDLFARQYFAHESPTGDSVSDLAKGVGYEYIVVGENLALGDFASSRGVVEAWMDSEGHRKNILSKAYTEIGIAAGQSMYEGRKTWIIVQSFGSPSSSCPLIEKDIQNAVTTLEKKLHIYEMITDYRKEQVEKATGTIYEKQALVDSYNSAARIYNMTVEEYKKLAELYNDEVSKYNSCLKNTVAGID